MILKIDRSKKHQTVECFGASAAWWAQDVGGMVSIDPNSGKPVREIISELLFNPVSGIGIDCYRYNLGAGSKSNSSCTFSVGSRATESFDISDTEYDMSRDENAVTMMKLAVRDGVDRVILFSNSPPERFTINGKACLSKPWRINLKKRNVPRFARYSLDVAEYFVRDGIPVKSISPVNEPVWVWTERHGQEGCHYRPWGVRCVMREFARQLKSRPALSGVNLSGAENGDLRWFNKTYTRIMLGDRLISESCDGVDVHSYFLPIPLPFKRITNNRQGYLRRFRRLLDKKYPGAPVRVTEWTHMCGGRDRTMTSALVQANTMYEDMTLLDVCSWQHWIAVSDVDYCDGLIYINKDETYEMTKRYYAFGNFTKYIPRGSVRVEADCGDGDVKALAFDYENRLTAVLINQSEGEKTLTLPAELASAAVYVTDENNSLCEKRAEGDTLVLPPRSVCTVCG